MRTALHHTVGLAAALAAQLAVMELTSGCGLVLCRELCDTSAQQDQNAGRDVHNRPGYTSQITLRNTSFFKHETQDMISQHLKYYIREPRTAGCRQVLYALQPRRRGIGAGAQKRSWLRHAL